MQSLKLALCLTGLLLSFALLARASRLHATKDGPSKADIAIAMVEGMGVAVNSLAQEVDQALRSFPSLTPAPLPDGIGEEDPFLDFDMNDLDSEGLEAPEGPPVPALKP